MNKKRGIALAAVVVLGAVILGSFRGKTPAKLSEGYTIVQKAHEDQFMGKAETYTIRHGKTAIKAHCGWTLVGDFGNETTMDTCALPEIGVDFQMVRNSSYNELQYKTAIKGQPATVVVMVDSEQLEN